MPITSEYSLELTLTLILTLTLPGGIMYKTLLDPNEQGQSMNVANIVPLIMHRQAGIIACNIWHKYLGRYLPQQLHSKSFII